MRRRAPRLPNPLPLSRPNFAPVYLIWELFLNRTLSGPRVDPESTCPGPPRPTLYLMWHTLCARDSPHQLQPWRPRVRLFSPSFPAHQPHNDQTPFSPGKLPESLRIDTRTGPTTHKPVGLLRLRSVRKNRAVAMLGSVPACRHEERLSQPMVGIRNG